MARNFRGQSPSVADSGLAIGRQWSAAGSDALWGPEVARSRRLSSAISARLPGRRSVRAASGLATHRRFVTFAWRAQSKPGGVNRHAEANRIMGRDGVGNHGS